MEGCGKRAGTNWKTFVLSAVFGHLGLKPRCVTSTLARMPDRYAAPSYEALVALAIRLQWIEIAIDIHEGATSSPPHQW